MSTKDVFDHHVKCFGEGDLQGILADYSPSAILFTPNGPLKGTHAIRPFFQAIYDAYLPGNGPALAWDHLAVVAIWGVAGLVLAIRFFRWTPRRG